MAGEGSDRGTDQALRSAERQRRLSHQSAASPLIGSFADTLVKTPEGWRFLERHGSLDFRPRGEMREVTGMSHAAAEVESKIDYLVPSSRINRRFWAPGREFNTGVYASYPVTIRNARLAGPFTLDAHGFCLARHRTTITDWPSQYRPDSAYAAEVAAVAMRLSGADVVVPIGGMMRTSGSTSSDRTAAGRGGARRLHAALRGASRRGHVPQGAPGRPRLPRASSASVCGVRCQRRRRTCRWRCARAARCAMTKARATPRST